MYFLIEHDGSKEANLKAKELIEFFESNLGATVETIISNDSEDLKVLDENFNLITRVSKLEKINEDTLLLILRLNDYV